MGVKVSRELQLSERKTFQGKQLARPSLKVKDQALLKKDLKKLSTV